MTDIAQSRSKSLRIEELRDRHSQLCFERFSIEKSASTLTITYYFLLDPDIRFSPQIIIPYQQLPDERALQNLAFNLGMIELISYWKAACPRLIEIKAGSLCAAQKNWWHDLLLHGLGEFFYINQIDFSAEDFVRIEAEESTQQAPLLFPAAEGDLLLIAGGKDSSLVLELLTRTALAPLQTFSLNPTRSTLASAKIANVPSPLRATRTIDPQLLSLNAKGYLNGHTPFSAYLAFLGTFVAALNGQRQVIVANEESASEENIIFHGMPINHQYSKSFRFEKHFREYCSAYLTSDIHYFSMLRPLADIQVSALFSHYPAQLRSFRSCNVQQKQDSWCGSCPKCAFVFLSLFPFIGEDQSQEIFGSNFFYNPDIIEHLHALCGLRKLKPFECVGSIAESREALTLSIARMQKENRHIPPALLQIQTQLMDMSFPKDTFSLLTQWSSNHFLPAAYETLLHGKLIDLNKGSSQ